MVTPVHAQPPSTQPKASSTSVSAREADPILQRRLQGIATCQGDLIKTWRQLARPKGASSPVPKSGVEAEHAWEKVMDWLHEGRLLDNCLTRDSGADIAGWRAFAYKGQNLIEPCSY